MSWPTGPSKYEELCNKVVKISSAEGMEALKDAHPIFIQPDLLVTPFPKADWERMVAAERTCKKWRMWWRLRYVHFEYPFSGPLAHIQEWVLQDILYNGRDLLAWIEKDMTVYFDGFPLLYKEEEA